MPRKPIKMHYSGGLRILNKNGGVTSMSAGYACCAYGSRAEKILQAGNQTEDATLVTCAACMKFIERARENGIVGLERSAP